MHCSCDVVRCRTGGAAPVHIGHERLKAGVAHQHSGVGRLAQAAVQLKKRRLAMARPPRQRVHLSFERADQLGSAFPYVLRHGVGAAGCQQGSEGASLRCQSLSPL